MKMDRRVTLQIGTEAKDEYGEVTTTFSDQRTVWAKRVFASGREQIYRGRIEEEMPVRWMIRWQDGQDIADHDLRLKDSTDQTYDVHTVQEVGRRRFLKLTTTRIR